MLGVGRGWNGGVECLVVRMLLRVVVEFVVELRNGVQY